MNTAQQWPSPFLRAQPIKAEGTVRAFLYSMVAHLALIAMFTFGINWRTSAPGGVEVELWDSTPVVERTETPPPTPIKEEVADIAVKKKPVEKEPPKKEVVKEVPKPVKVTPPKEKAKEPEKPKKAEEEKALSPAQIKANAAAEKARADQLARLRAAAGAEGGSGGQVGSSVGGGNAPPAYADKVRRKIKPLIVFNPESLTGNPAVIVLVDLAPDGTILKRSVVTPSGIQGWDQAVLQALDRAETFPKDDNGIIPMRQMRLTFKPKD